jgi:hypothetical protein
MVLAEAVHKSYGRLDVLRGVNAVQSHLQAFERRRRHVFYGGPGGHALIDTTLLSQIIATVRTLKQVCV